MKFLQNKSFLIAGGAKSFGNAVFYYLKRNCNLKKNSNFLNIK